jgi:hypothetical protein
MKSIALKLENILDKHLMSLYAIPEEEMSRKPAPEKWSKKEILGHLVDSTQNNIRRFIVAQYETAPKIVYNQDKWVSISGYQNYKTADLINLWYLLNKHLGNILKNTADEMTPRECLTEDRHTIEWLANDYVRHLLHHLHQVLNLEPVEYS